MPLYIARRLLWAGLVVLVVLLLTYAVFYILPAGDPALEGILNLEVQLRRATSQSLILTADAFGRLTIKADGAKTQELEGIFRSLNGLMGALPKDKHLLIHCHHGGRSLRVTEYLRINGYSAVSNVAGGIDAWSLVIDPTVPRY